MEIKSAVWKLENLRQVMNAPIPQDFDVPDSPAAGNKQTLIELNRRLEQYLEKVKKGKNNQTLQAEIDEAEKREFHKLDWNQTEEILKEIKTITIENAKKLVEIKTTVLEKEEYNRKLEEETKVYTKLEKELKDLENTGLQEQKENLENKIKKLKDELRDCIEDHKAKVDELCESLSPEDDSENSNLADIVKEIRAKYKAIGEKNMEEINAWYKSRFQEAKEEESQNLKQLEFKKSELNQLLKQKQTLKIKMKTHRTTIKSLEETQEETRWRVSGFKDKTDDLKKMLQALIKQTDEHEKKNRDLFSTTESLKEQIDKYQSLVESNKEPDSDQSPSETPEPNTNKEDMEGGME